MLENEVQEYLKPVMTFLPSLKRDDIMYCIQDEEWQEVRKAMKGISTEDKLRMLYAFKKHRPDFCATVVVQNYINALKRGGQIK